VIEEIPLGDARLKTFAGLPWRLYKGDPCWTPPLNADLLGNRLLHMDGLLQQKHPYHKHVEVTHFLAWQDGQPVGRISASVNRRFNDHYGTRIGFFGFFEVIQDFTVARALLDSARTWVAERGMTTLRGPGEYSNATHERQGILIDGFQYPPTMDLTHNPPFYGEFLEQYGFKKAKDYYAYIMDIQTPVSPRLRKLADNARLRRKIETRSLNLKKLATEVELIVKIYNDCWSKNWGFLPLTGEEAMAMADFLRLVADPYLVRFAFIDGEPAALFGAFPDPYRALRPRWRWYGDSDIVRLARLFRQRRHITMMRLMFFGVQPGFRKLGIDAVLFSEVKDYAIRHGYQQCETSLLLEDNRLILSPSAFMGGHHYKTWRIYDLPLI
jgi:GNAT superfamily N-acetyltransferase